MLVNPVVVRSADGDQVLYRVRSSLRTSKDVVRVDRAEASDLGDEPLRSASSITVEYLLPYVFRNSERLPFLAGSPELVSEPGALERLGAL